MFESTVLRRPAHGITISVGDVAQALLFYQKVHLVLDAGNLGALVTKLGMDGTLSLLGRHDISAVYAEETLAVVTNSHGSFLSHDFGAITFMGSKDEKIESAEERIGFEMTRLGFAKLEAKKFAIQFLKKVPVKKLEGNHFIKGGMSEAVRSEFQNQLFVEMAVRLTLGEIAKNYQVPKELKFDVIKSDLGFFFFSNIDFEEINRLHPPKSGDGLINVASLLSTMQYSISDLVMAAHYGGDYVTTSLASQLSLIRHAELLKRARKNASMQNEFSEIVLVDMPTVSEKIDSGERSIEDFFKMLDKARSFKQWVGSANPDSGLVQEYLKSITQQDWIQTPKAKTIRYVVSTVLDALAPTVMGPAGFFDNFLLEKLVGGWRPNHFVDGKLKPFLGQSTVKA